MPFDYLVVQYIVAFISLNLLLISAIGKFTIFQEAVEVHTTTTTKDIKLPGEDIHQTRQE